ncbi:MAG TPA: endopeptidase La [Planctomycetota bacterium]|nr:endopeptidase La [Planctomycetota bacterium]HRR79882.1 endopeptidase La [Planctomycetota bacterium]HRT95508.1 endopeptidase La [Planctomycetota bacterium]
MDQGAKPNSGERDERLALPSELPILPLMNAVIYPNMVAPLMVQREKSLHCIDDVAPREPKLLGLFAQKTASEEEPTGESLHRVGTAGLLLQMLKMPDGGARIIVRGMERIRIVEIVREEPHIVARVERVEETVTDSVELQALSRSVVELFQKIVSLVPNVPDEVKVILVNITDPGRLADFVAANLSLPLEERQAILEAANVRERLQRVVGLLAREVETLEVASRIQTQVQDEMGKTQREYYLREQMKAIQKELGQDDEHSSEIAELRRKLDEAKLPEEARKEADQELDRLSKIPPSSAEYTVVRTHLDWLIALPWSIATEDNLDIVRASSVLDEDHHDLAKVKDRILEFLAVRKLKPEGKGPILCFVGPPGVGKTSLGRSIARAMERKFIRMSLGGVRDEAEIRGHRRTYIGALPGRIIQGIRRAGSRNPVFMLDEVDKLGADFRGDPSAALLEVLDPEQNFSFSDHYIDVAFDLSKVMFITTANLLDPVPAALRDRMEVIELPGYAEHDKMIIARTYLVPRQVDENGLKGKGVKLEDDALRRIIREYTREAGVRNLEREIGTVCRKLAKQVAEGKGGKLTVKAAAIPRFLGPPKFELEARERLKEPGIAIGLVWTATGGDILFIESSIMAGKSSLTLTGQLGDVIKESAQAALTYIRAHAHHLGIQPDFFKDHDIHVHFPAGAIPKDGPSAGVTIAASLVSLLSGRRVRSDTAMTGEITLRGRVLPVGGIKEKVLAAHRAGLRRIVLPKRNLKDLEDVPQAIRDELEIVPAETLEDVLSATIRNHAHAQKRSAPATK